MGKTNFEKLRELRNWELAQIMDLVALHVDTAIPPYPGAQVSEYDHEREYLKWLTQPYDEEKGFMFHINDDSEEKTYITLEEMKAKREKNIFKGLLKKGDPEFSTQPLRTLGKYMGDYLIVRNSNEVEFFAEDGHGYTKNASEAGIFTIEEVEHFNAVVIGHADFQKRKELKKEYLAISILNFIHLDSWE